MSADEPTCPDSVGPLDEAGGLRECAACKIRFRPENESDLLCWLCSRVIDSQAERKLEDDQFGGWFGDE